MGDEHNWTVELGLIGEPTTEEKYQAALKRLGEYHDHVLDLEKQLSELEAVVKCCEDEEETEICFLKDVPGFWDAWIANKPKGYAMLEYLAHFVKGKDDEIARLNTDKGIIAMALKERGSTTRHSDAPNAENTRPNHARKIVSTAMTARRTASRCVKPGREEGRNRCQKRTSSNQRRTSSS